MTARGRTESGRTGSARQGADTRPSRRRRPGEAEAEAAPEQERFSILVCIDGTDDADRAIKYATRIGSGTDADMTMLYVRPIDQGRRATYWSISAS